MVEGDMKGLFFEIFDFARRGGGDAGGTYFWPHFHELNECISSL